MAFRGNQEAMHARIRALEAELDALRERASEDQHAALERNRALEQELEETRQALARAEWRSRGSKSAESAERDLPEPEESHSDDASRVQGETPTRSSLPEWQWQLAVFLGFLLLFVIMGLMAYAKATGGEEWWD